MASIGGLIPHNSINAKEGQVWSPHKQGRAPACIAAAPSIMHCLLHLSYNVHVRRYLGLYKDEIEAAIAYDKEAVRRRGIHAVTNFDLAEYIDLLGTPQVSVYCCCLGL